MVVLNLKDTVQLILILIFGPLKILKKIQYCTPEVLMLRTSILMQYG